MRLLSTAPFAFGIFYGYTPVERRSPSDLLKFIGVSSSLSFLVLFSNDFSPKVGNVVRIGGSLLAAPLITGFITCLGMHVGKAARKAITDV